MSFSIKIGKVTDPNNKIVKSFSEVANLTGTLKNSTSIIDPVIIIDYDISALTDCNYLKIDTFGRSYYIKDIISISNNLCEIHSHVDVLGTYSSEILANNAVLKNSESIWNKYIDDGGLLKMCYDLQSITAFPAGFDKNEFVLAVAGGLN